MGWKRFTHIDLSPPGVPQAQVLQSPMQETLELGEEDTKPLGLLPELVALTPSLASW